MPDAIPTGYQLVVKSWENDGDSEKTVTVSGLAEADTRFLIHVMSFFHRDGSRRKNAFQLTGNGSNDGDQLLAMVADARTRFPGITDATRLNWTPDENENAPYQVCEMLSDLLGTIECEHYRGEKHFVRVFDSFKVYYVPEPMVDVTFKFK